MVKMLHDPPKTIMEVYKMLPEGTLAELINGRIYMTPPPNLSHQEISFTIAGEIYGLIKKRRIGRAFTAPVGVFLDENNNVVQPDIVFVSNKKKKLLKVVDGIHGSPDFVLEILSPGNRNHDLKKKKTLYEHFQVQEYWIVDPLTKAAVGFKLVKGLYHEFFRDTGKLKSGVLKATIKF
ncbi:MAG TPA: Uma2 family endonuclease [Chryseosolibacter sp.]